MKTKPCMLLPAVGIAALGIYCYLPRPDGTSSLAKPERSKFTATPPKPASFPFTALPEEAPERFPEKSDTTAAAAPRNSKTVVSQPAPPVRPNGAPGREKSASIPAGRHPKPPPAPASKVMVPAAVRLSEKFRLPAGVMAQAMPRPLAERTQSPQVRAASEAVVTQFYQEISRQAALQAIGKHEPAHDEPAQTDKPPTADEVATNDDSGIPTIVVEPNDATEQIRRNADENYRIFFGDESYNQHTMRSAIEVMLPEIR